jgi:alpha-tubulin suppressor-like RCC1 family protein
MNIKNKWIIKSLIVFGILLLLFPPHKIVGASGNLGKVVSGDETVFVLKPNGEVWSMGRNYMGVLGDNTLINRSAPVQVVGPNGVGFLTNVKDISVTSFHVLALKNDGTVWSWGSNQYGQLGTNSKVSKSLPTQVIGPGGVGFLSDIIAIETNQFHSLALKSDGTLWTWGNNTGYQLGDNTLIEKLIPFQVIGPGGVGFMTNVKEISIGSKHSLALKNDGTVWQWGENITIDYKTPTQIKGPGGVGNLLNVKKISAGYKHNTVIKNDGTIWGWGNNTEGQLGDNTLASKTNPIQVLGTDGVGFLLNVINISNGRYTSMALIEDGTVRTWGNGNNAGIGNNTTVGLQKVPTKVFGENGIGYLSNIVQIHSGYGASYAIKDNGEILGWGSNIYGILMNETIGEKMIPVKATLISLIPKIESITSVNVNAGLLKFGEFTNQIYFDDYSISLQDAIVNIILPFKISVEDFTGTWNGWRINLKISELTNGSEILKEPNITVSCLNSKVFETDNAGLKTGIGSNIQDNFTCDEGPIIFGTNFPLISALNKKETAAKHIFEFPYNFLTLHYSNESRSGIYTGQTTFELIVGP